MELVKINERYYYPYDYILNLTGTERYKNMTIFVNNDKCRSIPVKKENDVTSPNPVLLTGCDQPLRGNTVRIQVESNFLSLCEVQIWVCLDDHFGENCTKPCKCRIDSEMCDKENGYCRSGCAKGYHGDECQTACCNGTYGENCASDCGQCFNNDVCDTVNGSCPSGCLDGYTPPLCTRMVSSNQHITSIVVGVVFAILAIITIGIGIFFLRRRGICRNTLPTSDGVQIEDIYDHINDDTENIYDTLRIYFNDDKTYTHLSSEGNLKQFITEKLARDTLGKDFNISLCDERHKTDVASNDHPPIGQTTCGENCSDIDSRKDPALISGCGEVELYTVAKDPTHLTVKEFWKMIWQRKVTKIVMLTHSTEMAQSMQYWPEENGRMTIGGININSSSETTRTNFTIRDFIIQIKVPQSHSRPVTQFHFSTWSENSFPPIPSLLTFLKKVTKSNKRSENDGPILVHCRSKGGRTGVFIALHSLMTQLEKEKNDANLVQSVAKFMHTRNDVLESAEQVSFVYEALLEALESRYTFYTQLEFDEKYGTDRNYTTEQEGELRGQFQALSELKSELSQQLLSDALLSENINKNRCQNILPANRTRPYLPNPVTGMNDYINAVVLPSYTRPASFLVTQTPLEETVEDFWRLVYHHNCETIVCLDDSQDALSLYPRENTSIGVGVFKMETVMKDRSRDIYTELHLTLSHKEQNSSKRDIRVFLTPISSTSFSPESSSIFLNIVQHLEDKSTQGDRKILVHCLDGSRVSGVFCSVMNIVSRLRLDKEMDIFLTIRELQTVRPQFVQSYDQYKLCFDVVKEYHPNSNTYINVGVTSEKELSRF